MSRILVGTTGSVAAIRTPALVQSLIAAGHEVKAVATEAALYFFDRAELDAGILHVDADEWPAGGGDDRYHRDDPVLHIELRRWAEVLLIAPLDANTLAKLAAGLADNCLSCVYRAWDPARPILLAPAMNTMMWDHPVTRRHLRTLAVDHGAAAPPDSLDADGASRWINENCPRLSVVGPQSKRLACGDIGQGAMAEVSELVAAVGAALARQSK